MKYALVYLMKGDVRKYHKGLVKKLAKKFNEPYLLKNPIPSHATLKYPFRTNKINEIEHIIKEFVKKQKPAKIQIKKINNFHKKVIYLQLDFSKKAIKTYKELIRELNKVSWLKWGEFDKKEKFHATLIYNNIPKNFKKIWGYISKLKPKFNLKFDNVSILIKPKNYWKVYKTYKI